MYDIVYITPQIDLFGPRFSRDSKFISGQNTLEHVCFVFHIFLSRSVFFDAIQ